MSAARSRRHAVVHDEEHESSERWLLTYADMITLLMVLFIVLFAVSQVDNRKFAQLKNGLATSFENAAVAVPGGSGILPGGRTLGETTNGLTSAQTVVLDQPMPVTSHPVAPGTAAAATTNPETGAIRLALEKALKDKGLAGAVAFRDDSRGLVVSIVTDKVLFDLGSDGLRADGTKVLDALMPVLRGLPNGLSVEGHTDSSPISTPRFASNWDLSVARATAVLRLLLTEGLPPRRLAAAGYADTRPLVKGNAARNRRVEIVVLTAPQDPSTTVAPDVAPAGVGAVAGASGGR